MEKKPDESQGGLEHRVKGEGFPNYSINRGYWQILATYSGGVDVEGEAERPAPAISETSWSWLIMVRKQAW